MAHLVMIESWVGAVGLILPHKIKKYGHTYTFVTRSPKHYTEWADKNGLLDHNQFNANHPLIGLAENVIEGETNNTEALIKILKEYQKSNPFDGVISCCDYYLQTVADVAKKLNLPGTPPEVVNVVGKKHLMREAVWNAKLPSPKFIVTNHFEVAQAFAKNTGYPVIVKAVDLCASEHVFAVETQKQLKDAFELILKEGHNIRNQPRSGVVLIEEFLRGEEFSVETISYQGKTFVVGVSDKSLTGYPNFIESGVMHPAHIPNDQRQTLEKFVKEVLHVLNYSHGLAHIEVKLTKQGPRIIEINPRMGGSYLFELVEKVTGIDHFKVMIDLALGKPPKMFNDKTSIHSMAIKFILPPTKGHISAIHGLETVQCLPNICRVVIDDVIGKTVRHPQDNNDFIGHIIAMDPHGFKARSYAEMAADHLNIVMN